MQDKFFEISVVSVVTCRSDSELEVLANEVAAAHGAASAPINQDQLHYLMSRGFPSRRQHQ